LTESARFFDGSGKLHETLREFSKRLDELHIPYAVTDGMALTVHGYARMTEDIDILIARPDLKRLHEALVGRGYKVEFAGGKNIRDTTTSVKIEFVRTGDFPGNGKPQPVSFPSPAETEAVEYDGIKFIGLACLVELKLASGMTGGADRAKDLVDVQRATRHASRRPIPMLQGSTTCTRSRSSSVRTTTNSAGLLSVDLTSPPGSGSVLRMSRPLDSEYEKRAAARRARMTGGVARSFAELDEASREFWAHASFAEKLQATHDALAEAWTLKGRHGPPPRFDGSTWGVLKFER